MKIIKHGNKEKEYTYYCPLCGCEFALTASELSNNLPTWCPECGNRRTNLKIDKDSWPTNLAEDEDYMKECESL